MRYKSLQHLTNELFRRLTGVTKTTFLKMVDIVREADKKKKSKGGRYNKLCLEDQLLITLEYLREYRTYFHISQSYGVSESSSYKTIKWIENTLIKCPVFSLPGRKALLKSDVFYEVVLIDATETPIERPKKDRNTFTQVKRKDTL